MVSMKDEIKFIQELSMLTWPPNIILNQNGWKLRLSEGITDRANSVSPLQYEGIDLNEDISIVERTYQQNNLVPVFQLPDYYEPVELREVLLKRGYKEKDETIVMRVEIEETIQLEINEDYEILQFDNEIEKWIEAFKTIRKEANNRIEGIKKIILRMNKANVSFYVVLEKDIPIAVGLSVAEENYMFVYNMFTHPDYRRKKIAQSILMKMYEWADINLVDHMILQVEADNQGAINLYKKAGFKERYRYRYLLKE